MLNKNKNLSIRITEEDKVLLESFGGQAKGFELIIAFVRANMDEVRKFEIKNALDKIKARK